MKKIAQGIGGLFIFSAVAFLFVHNYIVVGDGVITYDLFGFVIPHPPEWTSFIPILGNILNFAFSYFSMHGIVGILIFGASGTIGAGLYNWGSKDCVKLSNANKPANHLNHYNKTMENIDDGQFSVAGITLGKEDFPILYRWSLKNPETLEAQLRSIAKAWHNDNLISAAQAFESDLERS